MIAIAESGAGKRATFSAAALEHWIARHGLTLTQAAKLLESNALSVQKWKSGKVIPQQRFQTKFASLSKAGKRKIKADLEELFATQ